MRHQRYLVTTSVAGRQWQVLWESEHELGLDHPTLWTLAECDVGLRLTRTGGFASAGNPKDEAPATLDIPFRDTEGGVEFNLPPVHVSGGSRHVAVRILRIKPIPPAYLPLSEKQLANRNRHEHDIYVYSGVNEFMLNVRRVQRLFGCLLDGGRVFAFYKFGDGYKIKAYRPDLIIEAPNGDFNPIPFGIPEFIDEKTFERGTLRYGNYWWRVNRVDRPEELPGILFPDDDLPDAIWFKRVGRSLGYTLIGMMILAQILGKSFFQEKKVAPPQTVTLKQPKLIPIPLPIPTPPPKVVEKKPERPKKKIERERPKKVVRKEPPKAPPKRVVKAQPPPKARPVVKAPPPKPAPPAPNPNVVARQQLAKSLSFLDSPSKSRAAAPITADKSANRYKDAASADVKDLKRRSSLSAKSSEVGGDIDVRNSREVAANGGISGSQRGKGLNEVQGKVALNALYDPNAGAEMGSSLGGGKGMQMSGSGSISDALIEKVLSKYLSKFQYCYEKALLADASLAGTVVAQWTINSDGSVSDSKIVRSQIPNKGMQSCLTREIAKITFPRPSGGSVTIKYPFAFSSSSL